MSSRSARVAVGHPVDVASGHQFTAAHDIELVGFVPLVFRRVYNTAFLERTVLGPGWLHSFEPRLERDLDGFTFQSHDGAQIEFDDPHGTFESTGSLLNASASMELRREDHAQSWTGVLRRSRHLGCPGHRIAHDT